MKAVLVKKPKHLEIIDIEKPVLTRSTDVIIKMTAAGICGSDIGIYNGTNAAATYPRIIGHEMVGIVHEIGSEVKNLKIDDRVIINQVISCGKCYPCQNNRGNVCDNLAVRGVHVDGGYQEYIVVPSEDCYKLPNSISDIDAVMIEPTTIAIQACTRANLQKNDTLLIYGAGALGSSILRIANQICDNIIVSDVEDNKLKDAKNFGAKHIINPLKDNIIEKIKEYTNNRGVTVSIDAVCIKNSLMTLLNVTGNAGRIITMGFSTDTTEVNQFLITSKEIDIKGSRLQNKMFAKAIEMIENNKLNLNGYVSHTFPITKAQEAFDFIFTKNSSIRKVVLTFDF